MEGPENPDEPSGSCSEINRIRCFVKQDNLFVPGACTECHKLPSEDVSIKACSNCRLVYYCGKECQRNNWATHKEFCRAASSASSELLCPNAYPMDGTKAMVQMGMDFWTYANAIVNSVSDTLNRNLNNLETKTILYAKLCEICKDADHAVLTPCKICYTVFYCSEDHAIQDSVRHRKFCSEYFLALHCYHLTATKGVPIPGALPFKIYTVSKYKPMLGTMLDYIKPTFDSNIDACMTDMVSYPLSLLYALQHTGLTNVSKKINEVSELTILMLDAFNCIFKTMEYNLTWEYMLHLLPKLKKLTVMLYEPNGRLEPLDVTCNEKKVELCSDCISRKCKLTVYTIADYEEFKCSDLYKFPDVLCNHHVSNKDGTDKYLAFPDPKVPVILLSTDKKSIDYSLNMMKGWKKEKFNVVMPLQLNPFRGRRPQKIPKDYMEDGSFITYANSYIMGLRRQVIGKSFLISN